MHSTPVLYKNSFGTHFLEKHRHRKAQSRQTVAQHPWQVGHCGGKIAGGYRLFQLDPVNKGQKPRDLLESTANQLQIKPDPLKPCGEIGQQRAADAAHLLLIQQAAQH